MQEGNPLSQWRHIYHVEWMDDILNQQCQHFSPCRRSAAAERSAAQHCTAVVPQGNGKENVQMDRKSKIGKLKKNFRANHSSRPSALT